MFQKCSLLKKKKKNSELNLQGNPIGCRGNKVKPQQRRRFLNIRITSYRLELIFPASMEPRWDILVFDSYAMLQLEFFGLIYFLEV